MLSSKTEKEMIVKRPVPSWDTGRSGTGILGSPAHAAQNPKGKTKTMHVKILDLNKPSKSNAPCLHFPPSANRGL